MREDERRRKSRKKEEREKGKAYLWTMMVMMMLDILNQFLTSYFSSVDHFLDQYFHPLLFHGDQIVHLDPLQNHQRKKMNGTKLSFVNLTLSRSQDWIESKIYFSIHDLETRNQN